jgi:hypothetical protein
MADSPRGWSTRCSESAEIRSVASGRSMYPNWAHRAKRSRNSQSSDDDHDSSKPPARRKAARRSVSALGFTNTSCSRYRYISRRGSTRPSG